MSGRTPQWQLLTVVKTLERLAAETLDPGHAATLEAHAEGLWILAAVLTPKVSPNALTPAQARVLTYIRQYIAEHGHAPTRKEISEAFSYASPNAAQEHVRALERKGLLTRTGGEARAIRLNQRTAESA
jgi:DNA-binding MarR family transcriptional regulator